MLPPGGRPAVADRSVAACAARRDLREQGAEPRIPPAAAARRPRDRRDAHRRVDAAHPRRSEPLAAAGASRPRSARSPSPCCGGAAGAAAAAADPRDPRRPDAPRARRVRRAAESRPGRRVRRARHVLQRGERAAVGRPVADGGADGQPRVGGRTARGRRRDHQRARRAAVREPGDADAVAAAQRPAPRSIPCCRTIIRCGGCRSRRW